MTAKEILLSVATLAVIAAPAVSQTKTVYHPLDGLTTSEYWTTHDVLQQSGHMTSKTLVASLLLHEQPKDKVLAWKEGDPIAREADVILEDNGKTIEARVDIQARKLEFWNEIPGKQAPITVSEISDLDDVVKSDPRVIAALKARGITDLSSVHCGPVPVTFVLFPQQRTGRIGYANCTDSHGAYHSWGRAISGLYILTDTTSQKVLDVTDEGQTPIPAGDINYEETGDAPREGTKPLLVTQPSGPSYKIDKGEVTWQNWHFRFRFDSRVGIVVNKVAYQDGSNLRSVMYEGSLAEMYVPYMDTETWWNSRAFLDAGEFLLGGFIKPVGPDDCPAQSQYFNGVVPSDKGLPVFTPRIGCLYEHATDKPAWRHIEDGLISGRPSRELVLRTALVAGNYDYIIDWVFQQDGTIRVEVGATGIVETKAVKESMASMHETPSALRHGTLVDHNLVAVNHDHYFSFRIDLDVDGPQNSFMVDRLVPEAITGKVRKSIWAVQSSIAKTEKDGILDVDPRHPGMWSFINPSHHSELDHPSGYEIMPGPTAVSIVAPDDPALKVGAFAEHQMWVTPYKPDERYAAGVYVTSSDGLEGLPAWTKANRSIENTDIVGWYTLGIHHVVRVEDWPIMPTLWHDFLIRPSNFFTRNPALDLPHQQ